MEATGLQAPGSSVTISVSQGSLPSHRTTLDRFGIAYECQRASVINHQAHSTHEGPSAQQFTRNIGYKQDEQRRTFNGNAGWYQGCVVLYLLRAVHHHQMHCHCWQPPGLYAGTKISHRLYQWLGWWDGKHSSSLHRATNRGGADMLQGRAAFKGEFNKLED